MKVFRESFSLLRYENPSQVLEEVHKAIDELNDEILPEDVNIHIFLDRTHLVNATLNTVSHTLLFGVVACYRSADNFSGKLAQRIVIAITIPSFAAHRLYFHVFHKYSG